MFGVFGIRRSVKTKQCNGIIISGDHNKNISIHYGPTDARLTIPFKPESLTGSIDSLLIWQSQLTPLIGRDKAMDELMQWAKTGPSISLKLIYGEAGTGKTRLAFEVASKLRKEDWEAGQLNHLGDGSAFSLGVNGTLLIIDSPEQQLERVQQLLQAIKEAEAPVVPLRILLLSRHPQLFGQPDESLNFLVAAPLSLAALDKTQATWLLLESAWPRLCKLRELGHTPPPIDQKTFSLWLEQHENHAQPLYILAYAIHLIDQPHATTLDGGKIIQRLVRREVVRLEKKGSAKELNKLALPLLKGLAAICGGITAQQLKNLADHDSLTALLPDYERLRDSTIWQEESKRSGQVVELQPNLLAAALLSLLLRRDDDQPGEWLYAALDVSDEIESAASRLGRLIHDATQVLGLPWPQKALTELSNRLTEGADRADGLKVIQRAVVIHEKLAADNFAAYEPELARSLNTLSNRLAESGDRADGLKTIQRAVAIHEKLAADNFAAHGSGLASSLNNLSNRLAESGDRADGLKAIQRAVAIHEKLAADNFATHGPELASCLNNLSNRLAESSDQAGGLKAIQRAVAIHEKLAADNFAAHGPELARSLSNLSVHLTESGDRTDGLKTIQRAVAIHEKLAADNFAAHRPELASSLAILADFHADDDHYNDAISTVQRAIELIEPYAIDGSTHSDWLEIMKNNLARYQPDLDEVT